jgi:hypothetical protein
VMRMVCMGGWSAELRVGSTMADLQSGVNHGKSELSQLELVGRFYRPLAWASCS